MIRPRVSLLTAAGELLWETVSPRSVAIQAPFGAQEATARVEFFETPKPGAWGIGDHLEIRFADRLKFRGSLTELRTDSAAAPLTLVGSRRPERLYQGAVRGLHLDRTPTEILADILAAGVGPMPGYAGTPSSDRVIDLLDFQGLPLFYAIDLLAKLAGNWLWWIDWEGELHFVPPTGPPEHVVYFDPDRMTLQPATTDRSIENLFYFQGGVTGGAEFVRYFEDGASRARFGDVEERLYARSIRTAPAFAHLQTAILQQAPWPTVYRWVDAGREELAASYGERFELRGNPLFPVKHPPVFRIAAEEIEWTEAELRVRHHLAEGFESATRLTRYLDHDPLGATFVAARLGPFTLDLSALDSEAHLDP